MSYLKSLSLKAFASESNAIHKFIALSLSLFLLPVVPVSARTAAIDHASQPLERTKAVEREMAAGTKHIYSIALESGQFLRISVDQKGVDVVTSLLAPGGELIVKVNTPNGTSGNEEILHIAEASGTYLMEIEGKNIDKKVGRYEVKISELCEASPANKNQVLSQRAFLAGEQFRLENNTESWRKASVKYEEALNYARLAGDKDEEASMLTYMGGITSYLGDQKKSIDYFSQAASLFQSLKDVPGEASAASHIARGYLALNDYDKSIEFYNKAYVLRQSQNDKKGSALVLHNLGVVYSNLRKFTEAHEYYIQALSLERAIEDRSLEGSSLHQIGTIHYQLGNFEKAIDYFSQSLSIRQELEEEGPALTTRNNLAAAYGNLGDNDKAIEMYKEIIPRARKLNRREALALSLSNLGRSLAAMEKHKEAMEYYNESLEIFRLVGNKRFELGVLRNIGDTYISLGDYQKAAEYMNQSLAIGKATFDGSGEANATFGLALIDKKQGNLAEARKRIDQIIGYYESRRPTIHIRDLRDSSFAQMHDYYAFKIDLLMQEHKLTPSTGYQMEAFDMSERARARSLIEMLRESRADIRQGIASDLLERERSLQTRLNSKSDSLNRLRAGKAESEKVEAAKKEIEAARIELQEVQAEIRAKSPRYAALTQPQPMSLADIQKQVLDKDTTLLEYSLGKDCSYLWVVTQTSFNSFQLPASQKIEEAARRVYDILTARNKVVKFETTDEKAARVEAAETEFAEAAAALSAMIIDPAAAQLKTKKLLIVADGTLQYIPFSALPVKQKDIRATNSEHPVSESGQKRQYRPLIVDHDVVNIPSASALGVMRREIEGRKPAPKSIAIFADPVFELDDERVKDGSAKAQSGMSGTIAGSKRRSFDSEVSRSAKDTGMPEDGAEMPRLPFSRKEARTIASLVPASEMKMALDFDASRAAATSSDLSNYRYIHFATHSLINSRQPELSGIVLSLVDQRGGEQDGFLRAHEIYNLNLPAELVVLSGCQTGLGKHIRGEGIIGITRGFMYAGAARVMVSLWDVDDEATSELMSRFYRAMLNRKEIYPATALREAQLSMWKEKRWRSAYYWAGFILQGEPN